MITVRTKPHGFTLIEILVVIIVLGLLAALVGPRILGRVSEAKSATARTQIALLGVALDNYRLDNGTYPTTEQGLDALQEKPTREPVPLNWRGPYLRRQCRSTPGAAPTSIRPPASTIRPDTTFPPSVATGNRVARTRTPTSSADRTPGFRACASRK